MKRKFATALIAIIAIAIIAMTVPAGFGNPPDISKICPEGSLPIYGNNIDKACGGKVGVTLRDREGIIAGKCQAAGPEVVMCVSKDWCKDGNQIVTHDRISCDKPVPKDIDAERRRLEEDKQIAEEKAAQEKKTACRKKVHDECLNRDHPIYGTPNQECNDPRTHYMVRRDMRRGGKEMPECYFPSQIYDDCVGKCILRNKEILESVCADEAKRKCE